jgi:ribosomal protein S18 acetylase RimI-like enzyme
MLRYSTDDAVTVAQFRDVLARSTLGARRPLADEACLQGMLAHANLLVSCWHDDLLVGIARSVTDFHYCCYLSDLAVDQAYQRQGIGRQLIHLTQSKTGPQCKVILLSAPAAVDYYPRIGFEHHPQAWLLPRERRVVDND